MASDKPLIYGGLAAFLALITFPVWYNLARGASARPPELARPAQEKTCVAPVSYMRTSHMDLLTSWREDAVRRNIRSFTAFDGRSHRVSLTGTCLNCHSNKAEFCDRCHNYAAVSPYCFDCHIDPKQVQRGAVHASR